ncbi:MAG: hypothetical protein ABI901_14960 [Roseiflexaceae bacterium]
MYSIRTLAHRLGQRLPSSTAAPPATIQVQRRRYQEQANAAFQAFQRAYPAYDSTARLDRLRATEYARLDQQGQVYLDYTGGGLYAESQLRDHIALLNRQVFGNPHSKNLTQWP